MVEVVPAGQHYNLQVAVDFDAEVARLLERKANQPILQARLDAEMLRANVDPLYVHVARPDRHLNRTVFVSLRNHDRGRHRNRHVGATMHRAQTQPCSWSQSAKRSSHEESAKCSAAMLAPCAPRS